MTETDHRVILSSPGRDAGNADVGSAFRRTRDTAYYNGRRMNALVLTGPGRLELKDVPAPNRAGECLIRVRWRGSAARISRFSKATPASPAFPGMSSSAWSKRAPADERALVGKRVVGEINVGCGVCAWCRPARRSTASAAAFSASATATAPSPNTWRCRRRTSTRCRTRLTDEQAVFVEPVAAACRIFEQIDPRPRGPRRRDRRRPHGSAGCAGNQDGRRRTSPCSVATARSSTVAALLGLSRHSGRRAGRQSDALRRRRRRHRPAVGIDDGAGDRAAARHRHPQVDVSWRGAGRIVADRRRRGDDRRFAVRPLCAGDRAACLGRRSRSTRSSHWWRRFEHHKSALAGRRRTLRI